MGPSRIHLAANRVTTLAVLPETLISGEDWERYLPACTPITISSGKHTWKIRYTFLKSTIVPPVYFGVTLDKEEKLANSRAFCVSAEYSSDGWNWRNGVRCAELPCFASGDTVTFSLDMTGSGILRAAINSSPPEIVACNLADGIGGGRRGFNPVIWARVAKVGFFGYASEG
jgi:hypothetical protein